MARTTASKCVERYRDEINKMRADCNRLLSVKVKALRKLSRGSPEAKTIYNEIRLIINNEVIQEAHIDKKITKCVNTPQTAGSLKKK
jgi:hypothetical protein